MTLLNVTDANTGEIVAIDTENPSGNLYVVDANTGNRVSIDLSSPTGNINVIDADTGNIVSLDLANLTGVITIVDANTGNFFDVDLDNPSGLFYTRDENTGDLVQIDLSVDTFFKSGSLVIPQLGEKVAPTLAITLSQYIFKIGETATVTFTFSEEVMNFTVANITAPNGSLSSFGITGNPLVYTATFTPTNGVTDITNVITVNTNWTDLAGNHPISSTNSSNYTIDTTRPTVAITSTETSPTFAATIPLTITFSEAVTGFAVGDITVVGCTLGSLTTSDNITFSVTATPTANSITVDIAAGVCQDASGNLNTEATQFAIISLAYGLTGRYDLSDITTLFQDAAGTNPVTADGQQIGRIADKSGNNNHATRTPSGAVVYKANIKNGLSIGRFSGAGGNFSTGVFQFVGTNGAWTAFAVSDAANYTDYRGIANQDDDIAPILRVAQFLRYVITTGTFQSIAFNTVPAAFTAAYGTEKSGFNIASSVRSTTTIQMWVNGDAGTPVNTTGTPANNADNLFIGSVSENLTGLMIGDIGEFLIYSVNLSAAARTALENYLNTKWAVF